MKLNFLESLKRKPAEKTDEQITEEIKPFVENFERKMLEAKELLEVSGKNSSQKIWSQIEALIIDMNSNLREITNTFKKTKAGQEYFFIEEGEEKDSLLRIQQGIILEGTAFASYSSMVLRLKAFEDEAKEKLTPAVSEIDSEYVE